MTDNNDDNTDAGPTEQSEAGETSSTDDTVDKPSTPPRWYVRVGLIAVVVVVAGMAFINPAATFLRSGSSKHAAAQQKSTASTPINGPAAAPTVAPNNGPAATPQPNFSTYDEKFLSLMSHEGWRCRSNSGAEQCKTQIVSFAHQICSHSGQSIDVIYQNFDVPAMFGPGEKRMAIANAEQSYPNCTFLKSP